MRFDTKMQGEFTPNFSVISKNLMLNGFLWANHSSINNGWFHSLLKQQEREAALELMNLFAIKGPHPLRDIDGSFLLAVHDQKRGRSYLYRSLLCKMSLYYRIDNGNLRWSTNPLELLDSKCSIYDQIQKDLLVVACFDNNPPNNQSFFKDIYRLPPGSSLIYAQGNIQVQKVDQLEIKKGNKYRNIWGYVEEANELVDKTFRSRFSSNETIAVQLSGGIDSASVICRLKQIGVPVVAFHWSFRGINAGDETHDARLIADYLKVPLTEIEVSTVLKANNYINPNWKFHTPYGHSFYKLFELTAQKINEYNIEIIANGHFGDHLFGPLPDISMKKQFNTLSIVERLRYWRESIGTNKATLVLDEKWEKISPKMFLYKDFLTSEAIEVAREKSELLSFPKNMKVAFLEVLNNETESSLQNKLYEQNVHMIYPLANRELIELALRIPYPYRNIPTGGMWVDKPILRLMNIGKLPPEIISKNYNYHMGALDEQYIIQNSSQIRLLLENSLLAQYGVIHPDKLREVMRNKKLSARLATSLIACCMVEIWLQSLNKVNLTNLKEENYV